MNDHIFGLAIWSSLVLPLFTTRVVSRYFMYRDSYDAPHGKLKLFLTDLFAWPFEILFIYKFIEALTNDLPYVVQP